MDFPLYLIHFSPGQVHWDVVVARNPNHKHASFEACGPVPVAPCSKAKALSSQNPPHPTNSVKKLSTN